jgi:hypothetical protein
MVNQFTLRVVPLFFAAVLSVSVVGGLATSADSYYNVAAVTAAVGLAVVAAVPHLLFVRLAAVGLASITWLGRAGWFLSGEFGWPTLYAVLVLMTLTASLSLWAMAADWIVVRGRRDLGGNRG